MEHEEKFILNTKEAKALYDLLGAMNGSDHDKLLGGKKVELDKIYTLLFDRFNKESRN